MRTTRLALGLPLVRECAILRPAGEFWRSPRRARPPPVVSTSSASDILNYVKSACNPRRINTTVYYLANHYPLWCTPTWRRSCPALNYYISRRFAGRQQSNELSQALEGGRFPRGSEVMPGGGVVPRLTVWVVPGGRQGFAWKESGFAHTLRVLRYTEGFKR